MRLSGNTILITGGTSGIGRQLAEALYRHGNKVIIVGRRQALLDEITFSHPGMEGIPLDVQEVSAVETFANHIRERFPELNVLINNAGISRREVLSADAIDYSLSESIINTNLMSVLRLTMSLLPTLKQQARSTIITTTSGLAFVPRAIYPTYCATKAFLHSWLQSLRIQLQESSVEILELAPPYVQTELGGPSQAADPKAMPLSAYIAEVMEILGGPTPPRGEILVERVKALRFAELDGRYEQILASLNAE